MPTPISTMGPESDIVADIIAVKKEMGLEFNGEHVKIHQKLDAEAEIPLEVQLNDDCNHYAKEFLRNAGADWVTKPTSAMSPSATETLHITELLVTNNYRDRLEEAFSSIGMREYFIRREGWDTTTLDDVDWPHLEYSITKLFKSNKQSFSRYVKFMIDMPHTGHQKQKFTINMKSKPVMIS